MNMSPRGDQPKSFPISSFLGSEITQNPFYTSLKPWNRKASDMWNFAHFLQFWGWRL